jgi:hypothetical protein
MSTSLTSEAFSQKFFEKIPHSIRNSLTPEQYQAIEQAYSEQWKRHPIDIRYSFGFWRWRYYIVLIGGRDRRRLTRKQQRFFTLAEFWFLMAYAASSALFGLLILYLIKSALGIDLFPNFHVGIWTWLTGT